MGMFDHVVHTHECPLCGTPITKWQSKSGGCTLDTLQVSQVDSLYGECPNFECNAWVDARPNIDENVVSSEKMTLIRRIVIDVEYRARSRPPREKLNVQKDYRKKTEGASASAALLGRN